MLKFFVYDVYILGFEMFAYDRDLNMNFYAR